jgi:hypothetical protein
MTGQTILGVGNPRLVFTFSPGMTRRALQARFRVQYVIERDGLFDTILPGLLFLCEAQPQEEQANQSDQCQ